MLTSPCAHWLRPPPSARQGHRIRPARVLLSRNGRMQAFPIRRSRRAPPCPSPLRRTSRRLKSARLSISPRATPDPCVRRELPPTASATRTVAASSITCENSAVPSLTSNRRSGSKSQAVPNPTQRRPGSSALIRPESRLRWRRRRDSARPRRIHRETKGLRRQGCPEA